MLHYAVVFFIIALIAAVFGFGGIAAGAVGIAKILFFVFLILAAVSLIAKDATVFIMGASMVVAMSWMHRQANHVDGAKGSAVTPSSRKSIHDVPNAGYSPSQ